MLRLLRGEDLDAVSRELKVKSSSLAKWRDQFLASGQSGLMSRTPDDVYHRRRLRKTRDLTAGTLPVRFLDGDPRLPILRLRDAA